MLRTKFVALAILALTACGGAIEMTSQFDPNQVAYISRSGSADLAGQAFLRQRGGGVVTCAGSEVALIPAGDYAKEFINRAFGDVNGGQIPAIMAPQIQHPVAFGEMQRKATCDAEGDFEFTNIANGDYYLATIVLWEVPGQIIPEGGAMSKFVRISGGQDQRVILN